MSKKSKRETESRTLTRKTGAGGVKWKGFTKGHKVSVIIVVNIVKFSRHVAQNGLELVVILLTQPTKFWDYRCEP